jgi:hypothetical protein
MSKGKARARANPAPAAASAAAMDRDVFGVLVGWSHGQFNGRIDLKLQTAHSTVELQQGKIDIHHVVMTPNQAVLLANYLYTITNQTPPPQRKRGRLARWFGI